MGALAAYSISVSVVMIILWLIYRFLLAQENQPKFNRAVLIGIYLLSFLAPLLPSFQYLFLRSYSDNQTIQISIGEITGELVEPFTIAQPLRNSFATIIVMIYLFGVIVSILNTIIGTLKIYRLISRFGYQTINGVRLVITDGDKYPDPFSFMNYIIMSRKDYESAGASLILIHETQHIKLKHPIDLLIAQLSIIFCWYNPAAYLLRSELRDAHEFQADMAVLNSGIDIYQYQLLLIKKAVGKKFPAIANSLNHSKLKKRLTMMSNKKTSGRGAKMRALAIVPALGLTLLALNCTPVANALSKLSDAESIKELWSEKTDGKITAFPSDNQIMVAEDAVEVETATPTIKEVAEPTGEPVAVSKPVPAKAVQATPSKDEEKVYNSVQQMPQFPGGEKALFDYIIKNLRYPKSEIDNPKTARVIVRFVVEATGKVGDVKIIRGASEAFDAEVIRVVKTLPDFVPGKENSKDVAVWYNLPIKFAPNSEKTAIKESSTVNETVTSKTDETPDASGVFRSVQKMPQFPGGEMALLEYVMRNLKYPESEVNNPIDGRVVISFVVEANGKIGDTKIMRSLGEAFDAEAVRVVKSLPDFIPGQSGGKNVAVWYNLPIRFKNTKEQKTE
ncbi:MAG: M56 family metallopeptidase [Muribaculaceae bacterium]|nr:M56 family metallopeptidase [Muribaculaceae bacterium]